MYTVWPAPGTTAAVPEFLVRAMFIVGISSPCILSLVDYGNTVGHFDQRRIFPFVSPFLRYGTVCPAIMLCQFCKHQEVHASVVIMQKQPVCMNCTVLQAHPHHDLGKNLASATHLSNIQEYTDDTTEPSTNGGDEYRDECDGNVSREIRTSLQAHP